MSTRYTVEISIAAIDEEGDWVKEWDGATLDIAASESEPLDSIMSRMYDIGTAAMEELRSHEGITISDRRPEAETNNDEPEDLEIPLFCPQCGQGYAVSASEYDEADGGVLCDVDGAILHSGYSTTPHEIIRR